MAEILKERLSTDLECESITPGHAQIQGKQVSPVLPVDPVRIGIDRLVFQIEKALIPVQPYPAEVCIEPACIPVFLGTQPGLKRFFHPVPGEGLQDMPPIEKPPVQWTYVQAMNYRL